MAFKVKAYSIRNAIARLMPIIPARTLYPITQDILLREGEKELSLHATDYDIFVDTVVGIDKLDGDPVVCVVPARPLYELLRSMDGDGELEFSVAAGKLVVKSESGAYEFGVLDVAEFPSPSGIDGLQDVGEVSVDKIREVARKVSFAASGEGDSRVALTGVYFDFTGGKSVFVATDAHVLSMMEEEGALNGYKGIVPVRLLTALNVALKDARGGDSVYIQGSEGWIKFWHPLVTFIGSLVEGRYPDYRSVIPDVGKMHRVVLRTRDILESVRRLSVFRSKALDMVGVALVNNKIRLQAQDNMNNRSGMEEYSCQSDLKAPVQIWFRGENLVKTLSRVDSDEFELFIEREDRAVIIKPTEGKETFLVMPLIIGG